MSKILPFSKYTELDKRYINETDIISEESLDEVIQGGGPGGGIKILDSTVNWKSINAWKYNWQDGPLCTTKAEAAEECGLTLEQFEDVLDGKYSDAFLRFNYYGLAIIAAPMEFKGDQITWYLPAYEIDEQGSSNNCTAKVAVIGIWLEYDESDNVNYRIRGTAVHK